MAATKTKGAVGARVHRVEDKRILTGKGRYVDDVELPKMLHSAFLRSDVAHGRITEMDAERARSMDGVHAVITGKELEELVTGPMNYDMAVPGHRAPLFPALAIDKVRFVGDPVALVVADSRALAEDACDAIRVTYERLDPVMTVAAGLAPGAPVLFEDLGDNVIYADGPDDFSFGDIAGAFESCDRIVELTIDQHRFGGQAMETRGGVADFDPATNSLRYHASTQAPHLYRMGLAQYLGIPLNRVHVLCADVGGAFGFKWAIYREDVVVAVASQVLGRPVKWTEDRRENLEALGSAREEKLEMQAAVNDDGEILALTVHEFMNHGSYPAQPPAPVFAALAKASLLGALRIPCYRFQATIVATNKNPFISYRGPGSVEGLARERLLDVIASELGIDPLEIRRKNLIPREEQPAKMASGATIDEASGLETLERAVELIDYDGFRSEQRRLRDEGRYLGIGLSNAIHPFPAFPDWWASIGFPFQTEPCRVRIEPDGHVTVATAQSPHGQSHETTLAQVAADELGVPYEQVHVVVGNTEVTPFAFFGTGASRAASMASGAALWASREVKGRVLEIAADALEVDARDLILEDAEVRVAGSPSRSLTLAEVATKAYMAAHEVSAEIETRLEATTNYEGQGGLGWSAATHIALIEVDAETGEIAIDRYLVSEDCGALIHPAVVEGQIRGGVAQGIGGVLYEHAAYDEQGRFLSGTLHDYVLPSALDIPPIEIDHMESPSKNAVNFRGVGEGGTALAPAAIANAVEDALAPFGARVDSFPLTPTRVLELTGATAND